MLKTIFIALLLLLIQSCEYTSNKTTIDAKYELTETYQYIEDSGKVMLRNWNKKYWELNLKNGESRLSYFDSGRGISSFELSVTAIKSEANKLEIHYDSTISMAHLALPEISDLRKGDCLMTLTSVENDLLTNSNFLKITSYKSEIKPNFIFEKVD